MSDLPGPSAKAGRASFENGEHRGERRQANYSPIHALLGEHLTTDMNAPQSFDRESHNEDSMPDWQRFHVHGSRSCAVTGHDSAPSVQYWTWRDRACER